MPTINNSSKKFELGQYFTRTNIVNKVVTLLEEYLDLNKDIQILEPSAGTRNFVKVLKEKGYQNVDACEIDEELTDIPFDFFELPLSKKYDLIIGNPPFTKYNVKSSYFYPKKYFNNSINPYQYLTNKLLKKEKIQIENVFILKAIKHLKNNDSSIGFVLPISFFIRNKNNDIKKAIISRFPTIIVYQNDERWVDEPIPCCFAVFTNIEQYNNKVILLYEDGGDVREVLDKTQLLEEELIPKSFLYKRNNQQSGVPLSNFLMEKIPKYERSYENNNVSGSNILEKSQIPTNKEVSDYCLAVVRVGNASVSKTGLINIKEDILNDMFFVFKFKEESNKNKELKELICKKINEKQDYFKNLTIRVGSKSIKKTDIFEFKINL